MNNDNETKNSYNAATTPAVTRTKRRYWNNPAHSVRMPPLPKKCTYPCNCPSEPWRTGQYELFILVRVSDNLLQPERKILLIYNLKEKILVHKPSIWSRNRQRSSQEKWEHIVGRRRRMENKHHKRQPSQRHYLSPTHRICTCKWKIVINLPWNEYRNGTYHITKPVNPPKNVLRRRDASPNAVSPRKRASVIWPINLCHSPQIRSTSL